MRPAMFALLLAMLLTAALWNQTRQPTPTFEGTLKMMTRREIILQLQTDQTVPIRRDRKTKFFENGKEIKPESIAVGTPLAIDVREDLDLKPVAVRVVANPPPPKAP